MRIYQKNIADLAKELNTDLQNGRISTDENQHEKSKWEFFKKIDLFKQSEFLPVLLVSASSFILCFIFSLLNRRYEMLVLTALSVVLSVIIHIFEKIILLKYRDDYSKNIKEKQLVCVVRNGKEKLISKDSLLVGDLLRLEEGDILYADGRIVHCSNLFLDEKNVFGLMLPSAKTHDAIITDNLPAEEQTNMLWKGSYVCRGRADCLVTALNEDCYIHKTGGRNEKKQRSFFYNKQNNIGHIVVYIILIFAFILFLLSAIFTHKVLENILLMGIVASILATNPIAALTEWTYCRYAKKMLLKGALIQNFEAFDGINRKKEVYFDADTLLNGHIKLSDSIFLNEKDDDLPYYVHVLAKNHPFGLSLKLINDQTQWKMKDLNRSVSTYRVESDSFGNICGAFLKEEKVIAASIGYWKSMLPLIADLDDELLKKIDEYESNGKMVWLMATDSKNYIPSSLDFSNERQKLCLSSLLLFDVVVNQEEFEAIRRLNSSVRTELVSNYSERFSSYLAKLYSVGGLGKESKNPCQSMLNDNNQLIIVSEKASAIEKARANVVVYENGSTVQLIYHIKRMFCGIQRALNYLGVVSFLSIFAAFVLSLHEINIVLIALPVLFMRVYFLLPSYSLIESVRNCTGSKRSMLLGLFTVSAGFVLAILGFDGSLVVFQMSLVFLSLYLLLRNRTFQKISLLSWAFLAVLLLIAVIPGMFAGVHWAMVLILAMFAPLSALLMDLFY